MIRTLTVAAAGLALVAPAANAAVDHVEITERVPLAGGVRFGTAGAYEKIRGKAWIALDPDLSANAAIVDLKLAPRDAKGRVLFSTDFLMLRPVDPAKRNGSLLYDVNNRGNIAILGQVQGKIPPRNDPTTLADMGNGFLLKRGFTLLWSAWTWDVEPPQDGNRSFRLDPPVATNAGKAITGKVAYEFLVDAPAPTARFTGSLARAYPWAVANDPAAVLTMRERPQGPRRVIPRSAWQIEPPAIAGEAPSSIRTVGGFRTGELYELTYTAKDPVVVGTGMAGIRDLLSYFKTRPFADAPPLDRSLIFGISQSARVIVTMLTLGMNRDEQGRPAFDGAYAHVPGAGKGSFNHRFAMPTRHFSPLVEQSYPSDYFPFTTMATTDPVSGRTASILDAARALGPLPKLVIANTSAEYWNRSASLLTTTPDGTADAGVDPSTRIYALTGSQHYVGRSHQRAPFTNCVNTTNHYPVERALIAALDGWVRGTSAPPASAYPKVADGGLVDAAAYKAAFPAIGLTLPESQLRPPRLDLGRRFATQGIVDIVPPKSGAPFGTRVPRIDKDGNDMGGVRQVELEAPLGTHTGWNMRAPETGFGWAHGRFDGSFVPFARTEAERAARNDPRPSIAARYPTKAAFLAQVKAAAEREAAAGFLLEDEIAQEVKDQSALYDRVMAHDPADRTCEYLFGS
jgi:hypothetical protein